MSREKEIKDASMIVKNILKELKGKGSVKEIYLKKNVWLALDEYVARNHEKEYLKKNDKGFVLSYKGVNIGIL